MRQQRQHRTYNKNNNSNDYNLNIKYTENKNTHINDMNLNNNILLTTSANTKATTTITTSTLPKSTTTVTTAIDSTTGYLYNNSHKNNIINNRTNKNSIKTLSTIIPNYNDKDTWLNNNNNNKTLI